MVNLIGMQKTSPREFKGSLGIRVEGKRGNQVKQLAVYWRSSLNTWNVDCILTMHLFISSIKAQLHSAHLCWADNIIHMPDTKADTLFQVQQCHEVTKWEEGMCYISRPHSVPRDRLIWKRSVQGGINYFVLSLELHRCSSLGTMVACTPVKLPKQIIQTLHLLYCKMQYIPYGRKYFVLISV